MSQEDKELPTTLVDPTPEEAKAFSEELQALVDKYSFHITAVSQITPKGTIEAVISVAKKVVVETTPQTDGEKTETITTEKSE